MIHRSHTELYYHFVWSTYNREKTILAQWECRLFDFLMKKSLDLSCSVVEVNGVGDHLHGLLRGTATISPAKIAHDLKGASSFMINKTGLCEQRFRWQDGYGVFSVSPRDVDMNSKYIRTQKQHHAVGDCQIEWEPEVESG